MLTFILTITTITIASVYTRGFLKWNENRTDLVQINDPILDSYPVIDTGKFINALQIFNYGMMVYFKWIGTFDLDLMLLCLIYFFPTRAFLLYLCPLKAHSKVITLGDPIVSKAIGSSPEFINDLFCSGHVATGIFTALSMLTLWPKLVSLFTTFLMGYLMLYSKVHYTIDIVIAPFVAFSIYSFALYSLTFLRLGPIDFFMVFPPLEECLRHYAAIKSFS